uniref:NAD-dependent epimerase/dehydratase domain-containing protein n=1 Tax=viral metagenome TaxID=1070528 RepID=A0A6C0J925_9ZZZZ
MKVLVTGGYGLVGRAIQNIYKKYDHQFIFSNTKECNLLNYDEVEKYLNKIKPDIIIHLAAIVGGLFKNINEPVKMYEDNIILNLNVLKAAHNCNIQNIISCLSTCIFPDNIKYPINEKMLNEGPPHESNFSYAYAKRMLEIHSKSYRKQFNRNYICIIPTNIYGPSDNFSLQDGHVIPALIHKCYLSKLNNEDFEIRGSGSPLRQFIYSEDLAELILWMIENYKDTESIILSVKDEISIKEVGEIIAKKFEYQDRIIFNTNYSDGQYKKTADNKKLVSINKEFKFTNINLGIDKTIDWFIENYEYIRK